MIPLKLTDNDGTNLGAELGPICGKTAVAIDVGQDWERGTIYLTREQATALHAWLGVALDQPWETQ